MAAVGAPRGRGRATLISEYHVDELALEWGWALARRIERDRTDGIDGQLIWQGDSEASLHYIVDATAGIGYVVLVGPREEGLQSAVRQVVERLRPWTLADLFEHFDRASEVRDRCQHALRIGLAAPASFDEGVFRRIGETYTDSDSKVRYAGLWAATYTGYQQFLPLIGGIAMNDHEDWIRSRAESIVAAFESAVDAP